MTPYRVLAGETRLLFSPIGLRLVDEFTGAGALGRVRAILDRQDAAGDWHKTDVSAVVTISGVLTYPGLERRAQPAGLPARRYRVRIDADFYRPIYRAQFEGIEFDAFPYNDTTPPATVASMPQAELLLPSSAYPFQTHVRVLRGVVTHAGAPVADVLVSQGGLERVLTDERGTYALPLRWATEGLPFLVDALDQRTGRTGAKPITLPQDLGMNQEIIIN
ncbi:MAG TPA: hypothetical protein VGB05_05575 [Pyrinomonadaceae bacterium]|jgi:hypothetical protein